MRIEVLRIISLSLLVGLFFSSGCGGDDTAEPSERSYGVIAGTVTLEGVDDFAGVDVVAGGASTQTDTDGAFRLEDISPADDLEVTASIDIAHRSRPIWCARHCGGLGER